MEKEGQVEIIGWLYQYYDEEAKNDAVGQPKSHKYDPQELAAATQLFTPDWIVKYMVDNSLGKLWIHAQMARHPKSTEAALADHFGWSYYMADAEQNVETNHLISVADKPLADLAPQDIRLLDPSMGSGHILVYAFDVFMKIYLDEGYGKRDAAREIVQHNLSGLDIDHRAQQLAYFALMMKLRQFDRNALTDSIVPRVFRIPATTDFPKDNWESLIEDFSSEQKGTATHLMTAFNYGDQFGSLIDTTKIGADSLRSLAERLALNKYNQMYFKVAQVLEVMVHVAILLSEKQDIIVTNPPYLGSARLNKQFSDFVKSNYPSAKVDLFAMFLEKMTGSLKPGGYSALVTMQSWMFLSSFEKLRIELLDKYALSNLMHMENGVMGIAFGTAVSIFRNVKAPAFVGTYHQMKFPDVKEGAPAKLPVPGNRYNRTNQANFEEIPGSPIAYWASQQLIDDFRVGTPLGNLVDARHGVTTGDNNMFIRQWFEVSIDQCNFHANNSRVALESGSKWFPYNKGGAFRKWYGNYDYVVNWYNDGHEMQTYRRKDGKVHSITPSKEFYFREAITWSDVTSGLFAARYRESGSIHDVTGMSAFGKTGRTDLFQLLGLLNSKVTNYVFKIVNPTIHLQIGNFSTLPVLNGQDVQPIVLQNVNLTRIDWDASETSWAFKTQPVLLGIAEHKAFAQHKIHKWLEGARAKWGKFRDKIRQRFYSVPKLCQISELGGL
ncbi:hypothetical protein L248_2487 [Schleiferilactobacillus shenzhenensis LY-73]|uniref:site-specific DNA-methyltransferase (adenine-specific) n=1 Tax=Schleiferilactobacillus shenzhenensis LY-73 TaxID=1231336 RepID=U4TQ40_9LACO|nr:hypothetical protein L248_2487 [Schleiferilactobacillus shenzhenensis LY-73]